METTATKTTFPKYAAYKDSGVEWLGEIPEGWEISRLRNIFFFSKGLTITKENLQEKGIYCVNYGEIHSKFGFEVNPEIHELKCVSEEYLLSDSNSLLNNGDFVFADTSEDIEGSGNFTYLNSKIRTFAGYHTVIARLKTPVNERFVAYVITSQSFRNQIRRRVKGVKVFSITQSLLKTVNFWFPPKKEQTAIAAFLDDKTAKIDRVIAQKQQMIDLLKERKQIIIQNAVTGKCSMVNGEWLITPKDKMKHSGVEWIGEIPEGWEVSKLKYNINIKGGFAFNSGSFRDEGIQVIKIANTYMNRLALEREPSFLDLSYLNTHKNWIVSTGDILMSLTGTMGKTDYGFAILIETDDKYLLNQRVAKISIKSKKLNSSYLILMLRSDLYLNQLYCLPSGTKQANLSNDNVINILMPTPTIEEQIAIVAHIETQSAKIDQAISLQQTQIEKLKEYKATLIDSAVTGKIKVG